GAGSTGISAMTSFDAGLITDTRFFSVLDTQTSPYPNTAVNEPGATLISAMTLFVAGSIRETIPLGSLGIHADPAPNAMPPSVFAGPTGTFATTWLVFTSI